MDIVMNKLMLVTSLLAFLLLSPAFAYTIGDGICEGGTENSTNSWDCAISIPNIDTLYNQNLSDVDGHYIKLSVVNVVGDAFINRATDYLFRGTNGIWGNGESAWMLKDNSSTLLIISYPNGFGNTTLLSNNSLDKYAGKLIEVVGRFGNSIDDYYPPDMYLDIINITVLGDATDDYYNYDEYAGYIDSFTVPPSTLKYTYSKVDMGDVITIAYLTRHNSTHLWRYLPFWGGVEMGDAYTGFIEIDEQYQSINGNFSWVFLGYNSPNTVGEFGIQFEGTIPDEMNTTKYGSKTLIIKGKLLNQTGIPDNESYVVQFWMVDEQNYNEIGDGICGSLESNIPTDWNYDIACRFGGMTGYYAAVASRDIQTLTLAFGVVFIILSAILPILKGELTLQDIISSGVSLIVGISLIVVGLNLILIP